MSNHRFIFHTRELQNMMHLIFMWFFVQYLRNRITPLCRTVFNQNYNNAECWLLELYRLNRPGLKTSLLYCATILKPEGSFELRMSCLRWVNLCTCKDSTLPYWKHIYKGTYVCAAKHTCDFKEGQLKGVTPYKGIRSICGVIRDSFWNEIWSRNHFTRFWSRLR